MEIQTMSSLNDYIKFTIDIEDQIIIFSDYSNENINGKIYKIYLAELIQPACPYCRSTNLKHNVITFLTFVSLLLMLVSPLLSD